MKLREALRVVRDEQATANVRVYLHCLAVLDAAAEAHEARCEYCSRGGDARWNADVLAFDKLRALESVTREEAVSG